MSVKEEEEEEEDEEEEEATVHKYLIKQDQTMGALSHTARKQRRENQPPSFTALQANRSALLIRPEVTAKFRRT